MDVKRILGFLLVSLGWVYCGFAEGRRVEIGTLPGLRYDVKLFTVRPGEEIELVFSNGDDMLHNLVVTLPEKRLEVVQAAGLLGAEGPSRGYVPEVEAVLWSVPVVESGKSETVRFLAPEAEGDYPFVCTYPGHGYVMFGTMRVTAVGVITEERNELDSMSHVHQEVVGGRPIVVRGFMPDAGPASIAVNVGDGYSFCWDAGAVRFRYAWSGAFGEPVYREPMTLGGEVFYREKGGVPLRVGGRFDEGAKEVEFRGYRFDEEDRVLFMYQIDDVDVEEVYFVEDGSLVRRFIVSPEAAAKGVVFVVNGSSEGRVQVSEAGDGGVYLFPKDGVLDVRMKVEGKEMKHVH